MFESQETQIFTDDDVRTSGPPLGTVLRDDPAFDAAWQEGRAMTMERAVELALQTSVGPTSEQRPNPGVD